MSRPEALALPVITFWFMAATLIRLMAEQDMRRLTIANAAQSSEGATETQKRLVVEMAGLTEEEAIEASLNATLDKEGLDELRFM